jgi:NAD(P)-dependent dehydrogenase (short-subunit alcohol dehydrogenase family)
MTESSTNNEWALILGASSGFGEAAALELSKAGMNIAGVHFDRRATLPHVQEITDAIKKNNKEAAFFNINAADEEKRRETIASLKTQIGNGHIRVLLHSLAFGTLKPFIGEKEEDQITAAQMNMTLDVMAHSLVYWVQDLLKNRLFREGSRIFAMTSSGSLIMAPTYGAVSAAKCALESHVRQLALEFGGRGITINAIRAGVTDTPSLQKIPGHDVMIDAALKRNPSNRLTTPQDVAKAIVALSSPETAWLTGNVINIDGGEMIVGTK